MASWAEIEQKVADFAAQHIASLAFIAIFNIGIAAWMMVNRILGPHAVDPFPFILLNLMLSWMAGVQAPLIMISQKRQEQIGSKTIMAIYETQQHQLQIMEALQVMLDEQREHLIAVAQADEEISDDVEKILERVTADTRNLTE